MAIQNGSHWSSAVRTVVALLCTAVATGSATADDTDVLHKKFDDLQAAVKAKDGDKLWDLLSEKSKNDSEKISKEVREAYAKANAEEKRKQEASLGLSAKELSKLSGKEFAKSASVWRKFRDLPGSKIQRVVIAGDNATVNYLETDGDREKMIFLRQGNEWKAWLILPRPVNTSVLAEPDLDAKPGSLVSVADASKHVNEKCVIEMEVKSTGKSGDLVFLNSETNFRDEKNFTIVMQKAAIEQLAQAKVADAAGHFKGKTVRVTGTIVLFREKPQIAIEDATCIQIADRVSR